MIIGYASCSTADQNLDWQVDALKQYGCETIFQIGTFVQNGSTTPIYPHYVASIL